MHGDQAVVDTLLAHGLRMQAVEEFIHANAQDRRTAGPRDRSPQGPPRDPISRSPQQCKNMHVLTDRLTHRQETLFRDCSYNAKICTF
jgi:hypothetical protein